MGTSRRFLPTPHNTLVSRSGMKTTGSSLCHMEKGSYQTLGEVPKKQGVSDLPEQAVLEPHHHGGADGALSNRQ